MKRMTEIEIAGKSYPLNFSMKVLRLIGEEYGGVEEFLGSIEKMEDGEKIKSLLWMLSHLMEQGAQYMRLFEGKELKPLTMEHLEVYFDVNNASELFETITKAMLASSQTEVETEVEEKNAITTQST